MSATVSACTGACCAVFYLPLTPAEMTPPAMSHKADGQQIREMVLPLTLDAAATAAEDGDIVWPLAVTAGLLAEADGHLYTCRLWDRRTRRCIAYDGRPQMCVRYPYGQKCRHCGAKGGVK